MNRRNFVAACAGLAAVGIHGKLAFARSNETIRLVIGFGPGGPIDVVARSVAEKLSAAVNKSVIVENRPGANMLIAINAVKRSAPDGATFLFGPSTAMTLFVHTKRKLQYDPDADFVPVAGVATVPGALAVRNDSPATTLTDYFAAVKAGRIEPMIGVVSLGGAPHIGVIGMGGEAGLSFTPVPYPGGGGPLVTDLLGGHIPAAADGAFIALHKAGRARVLAVTTEERLALIPDVPTFKENGILAYRSFSFGLWAPAGTPAEAMAPVESTIAGLKTDAALKEKLDQMGILLSPQGSRDFAKTLAQDRAALGPLVEASGYKED